MNAQESIDIKDLKTPNSPGFQILDIAPSSIERPTNPKAFAASLLSLTSNGTAIPKNFAMEISPYWYLKSDKASVYKYLSINKNDDKSSVDFNGILNKLSISLASVYCDSTAGSLIKNTNYISFGVRTNIFTYRLAEQNTRLQATLKNITDKIQKIKSNDVEKKKLIGLSNKYDNEITAENDVAKKAIIQSKKNLVDVQIDAIIDVSEEKLEKELEADKETQKNLEKLGELPLIQIDGAFAYSEAFPSNEYKNKRFNRSGFWFNASVNAFSINKEKLQDNLSLLGSVRFISDNVLVENTTDEFKRNKAFDYGFKGEYTIKQFSISVEYLKREYSNNSSLNSERTIGVIQYKINDDLYFMGTYGKNFGDVNNLFSIFGINYGFGNTKLDPTK